MKGPASICSVLLAAAMLALAPASAGAEAANPSPGVCEALSGGVYWNFTTESFCEPGGGSGGGGPGGAIPKDHGSSGETIFVQGNVEGNVYCGSFSAAFVDRAQDCLNRGVKVSCSPVDGCFKCPEGGCVAGHARNRGPRSRKDVRKKVSSASRTVRHRACLELARERRDLTRRYGDIDRFSLSLGFSVEEVLAGVLVEVVGSGPGKGTLIFGKPPHTVEVAPSALPDGFWERRSDYVSGETFVSLMQGRNHCGDFNDLVGIEKSDIYYTLTHPSP